MTERVFPASRSKVKEDKRKWNLLPAGKWPSVIRQAGFYLGFFVGGGGGGGESILKKFFWPRSGVKNVFGLLGGPRAAAPEKY